jgi:ketosteroid isomerase-like protein
MTLERSKETVRAYVEAFNAHDVPRLRTLFTEDAVIYGVAGFGPFDKVLPIWHDLHHGMKCPLIVDSIAAEGDTVAVRYTERGTWVGPFLGKDNPTGKSYEIAAMEWFEMKGGKIHRRGGARDSAAMSRVVGM